MASEKIKKPRLILVCGAWGGGTTAVAGLLDSLGLETDGKCLKTTDSKTKNSFESLRFRQVIQEILSEETLDYIVDRFFFFIKFLKSILDFFIFLIKV